MMFMIIVLFEEKNKIVLIGISACSRHSLSTAMNCNVRDTCQINVIAGVFFYVGPHVRDFKIRNDVAMLLSRFSTYNVTVTLQYL